MGNSCSAKSYEVYDPAAPSALPGSADDLSSLMAATTVHMPGTKEYETCRNDRTWNQDPASFGRPSAIAVPKTAEEVAAIVQFANKTGAKLSIACGRHTPESILQNALMIDMSHGMDEVTVDAAAKTVTVQGGATIGKVDLACAPHGFIIPLGRMHTTGCAGQMVTTGAHAYCERVYGLGIDYLLAATVVTGAGEIVKCSATEHPDLFWAVHGGGSSNVGVIVEMTFNTVAAPNGGKFFGGSYVYLTTGMFGMPTRQKCMDHILECMDAERPREYVCSVTMVAGSVNPAIVTHLWFGDEPAAGKEYFKQNAKKIGTCVSNTMGEHDYWKGIQRFSVGPKGDQAGPAPYYFKGLMPHRITPEMGKLIVEACKGPFPKGVQPLVLLDLMGGRSQDTEVTATALPSRGKYWIVFLGTWNPKVTGPAGREFSVKWVRDLWVAITKLNNAQLPAAGEGEAAALVPVDSEAGTLQMGQQGVDGSLWGPNGPRLQATKKRYDPKNIFDGRNPEHWTEEE